MNLSNYKYIYFLGIGGIGMSALARYFNSRGKEVSGYDKTSTQLTDELIQEGIGVHFSDDIRQIDPVVLRAGKTQTLVVYTPAIPNDHSELQYFLSNGFTVKKRSEILGLITENSFTVAVAGTHGKTTTSSMIAHILRSAGYHCTAFLGGISKNYNSNLLLNTSGNEGIVVVEADEYDRSFLALSPSISVITSMDADHLDIYGNREYMIESYRMFASRLRSDGTLIYKKGLPLEDLPGKKNSYGIRGEADYSADNIRIANHRYHFDWSNSTTSIRDLTSEMAGIHNVENAVAAIAVARKLNIPDEKIKFALAGYLGVKRRFDYQYVSKRVVFIDDYAHHPEELRACITSARELYPEWRITGIFQPHLFSRTRDFAEEFGKSLSLLDSLILLDIYPAREKPIPGITSEIIFRNVSVKEKVMCSKDDALTELKKQKCEVVLTLGAGDIDQLVKPVTNYLKTL